ncbi:MAG: class I SAM-dependent methyltransferase [Patescibacteria group bacterium]
MGNENFSVIECLECKAVFTDIAIDAGYYEKYYLDDYYTPASATNNVVVRVVLRWVDFLGHRRRLKILRKFLKGGNKLLEIGCGRGAFLARLPKLLDKYGVEINDDGAAYVKAHYPDVTIYQEKIDAPEFPGNQKYDAIVMWHVLEHIDDPNTFLPALKKLLNTNGFLICDIPNRDSLGFAIAKSSWFHLDTPRHLFFYNYTSLQSLLKRHQLEIVSSSADPYYYFHDLSASLYGMLKRNNRFIDILLFVLIVPMTLVVRFIVSIFWPQKAEINTYVITHSQD